MLASIRSYYAKIPPLKRLVYLLAILGLATTHNRPGEWNDASRIATVQSLVESGSFVIDKSAFSGTGDKVFIDGHFYSDKPPMPSVLGAAVYLPLYHGGIRLHLGSSVAFYLVTLMTVRLFWLLGSVAFFLALEFTGLDAERRFLATLALSVGSLYFTWSTVLNSHTLAAAFLSIGFYFLLKARFKTNINLNLDLGAAGFFLSLASTADLPTGIFYALFFLYVLRDPRLRSVSACYVLPLFLTVLPALAMTYCIHHSIRPVQIVRSYFEYPGSPWIGAHNLSGMQINNFQFFLTYALGASIGPKGFLLYNPILWIALWGLAQTVRQRGSFFYEGIVIASGSIVLVMYYLLYTNNYSGWTYSIRWFVPMLPLLFFFLYHYFDAYSQRRATQFRALLWVSLLISCVGVIDPWSRADLSDVSFVANIREIRPLLGQLWHFAIGH